jgi:hypothetical protein
MALVVFVQPTSGEPGWKQSLEVLPRAGENLAFLFPHPEPFVGGVAMRTARVVEIAHAVDKGMMGKHVITLTIEWDLPAAPRPRGGR